MLSIGRFALACLVALAAFASSAFAQIPPTLEPGGPRYRFIGADPEGDVCKGVVNACEVDFGDLGVDSPRMYVGSWVSIGVLGTTRTATGRLMNLFGVKPGPAHRIGAKIIGLVSWRGFLQADIGAYDNTASIEIDASLYDVSTGSRHLVARQTLHTNSVGGAISDPPIPNFVRDFGSSGVDLAVDLERGHQYLMAIEGIASTTSGVLGLLAVSSYANNVFGSGPHLLDGYIERTSLGITLEPDYVEQIDSLRDEFRNHRHIYLTGRGEGHNNTEATTTPPITGAVPGPGIGTLLARPRIEVVGMTPTRVRLFATRPAVIGEMVVERRSASADWTALSGVAAEGASEDLEVVAGERYGYRIRLGSGDASVTSDEVWVTVPTTLEFGLEGAHPNPTTSGWKVAFTLTGADPATIDLFDIAGRRVFSRDVGDLGAGWHQVEVLPADRLPSGLYLLRLQQAGRALTTRVTMTR
jgi:hypothetical protein